MYYKSNLDLYSSELVDSSIEPWSIYEPFFDFDADITLSADFSAPFFAQSTLSPVDQSVAKPVFSHGSTSPLGELSNNLEDLEGNVNFVLTRVTTAREVTEDIQDALDTFQKIEAAADFVADTMTSFGRVLKLVSKVSFLKVPAEALKRVFDQLTTKIRKLEKKAGEIDDELSKEGGLKDKADDAHDKLSEYEMNLESVIDNISGIRVSVDAADLVYGLITNQDILTGVDNAVGPANSTIGALNDIFMDVTDTVTAVEDSFSGVTGLINTARSVSSQITTISNSLNFLRKPLQIVDTALRPIEWALDAIGFVFDTIVKPILDPILDALGISALLDRIGDKIGSLLPSAELLDPILSRFEELALDLGNGVVLDLDLPLTDFLDGISMDFLDPILDVQTDGSDEFIILDEDVFDVVGGDGSDLISGNFRDNVLTGGLGDDTFIASIGNDTIDGQGGTADEVIFAGNAGEYRITVEVDGTVIVSHASPVNPSNNQGVNTISGVERFVFNDTSLLLTDLDNITTVASGTPTFTGTIERDFVFGSGVGDVLNGGGGDDFLSGGGGADLINGGAGNDVISISDGNDNIDGGTGFDTADFSPRTERILISLLTPAEQAANPLFVPPANLGLTNNVTAIERLVGSDFNDWLFGSFGVNILEGGGDSDVLRAMRGDDVLAGGDGVDFLFADLGDDTLAGDAGDDYLTPGDGDDLIDGGEGFDSLYYGGDNVSTELNNVLSAIQYDDPDSLAESGVTHRIIYDGASQTVQQFDINGVLVGTDSFTNVEQIYAPNGDNLFTGTSERAESLVGGSGNDIIRGNGAETGTDFFAGGDGDDIIYLSGIGSESGNVGAGNDLVIYEFDGEFTSDYSLSALGSSGDDVIDFSASAYGLESVDNVNQFEFRDVINYVTDIAFNQFQTVIATDFDDVLDLSNNVTSIVYAGSGDDEILAPNSATASFIYGGDGNDILRANGTGNLTLFGGNDPNGAGFSAVDDDLDGDDTFYGVNFLTVAYTYVGGNGDDVFYGSYAIETFNGGDGNDLVSFDSILPNNYTGGVHVHLSDANFFVGNQVTATNYDIFIDIENVTGTRSADEIYGSEGANEIRGRAGTDTLYGLGGDDRLLGGTGSDELYGGAGNDVLHAGGGFFGDDYLDGGEGNDTAAFDYQGDGGSQGVNDATGVVQADLLGVQDYGFTNVRIEDGFEGTTDVQVATLVNIENIVTGNFNDFLGGDGGANSLLAGGGDDFLTGRGGDDSLLGGSGNDILIGGEGDDLFIGGSGDDQIFGGIGNDTLDYSSNTEGLNVDLRMGVVEETYFVEVPVWADTGTTEVRISPMNQGFPNFNDGMITPLIVLESDPLFANSPDDYDYSFNDNFLEDTDNDPTTPDVDFSIGFVDVLEFATDTFSGIENFAGGFGDDTISGTSRDNVLSGNGGSDTLIGDGAATQFGFAELNIGGQQRLPNTSNFEGSRTDYVEVSNLIGFIGSSFTFEMLYQASEVYSNEQTFYASYAVEDGAYNQPNEFLLFDQDGLVKLTVKGVEYQTNIDASLLNDGSLHRLSFTYQFIDSAGSTPDIGRVQIFVDGVTLYDSGNTIANGIVETGGTLIIGQEQDIVGGSFQESQILSGSVADVRLWNEIRTQAEISADAFTLADTSNAFLTDNWIFDNGIENRTGINVMTQSGGTIVTSGTGNDTLDGGEGADTLIGGFGNDLLIGGAGADSLDGGSGFDTADYSDSEDGVAVLLYNGTGLGGDAQGDTFSNIESVVGSQLADTLIGASTQEDTLFGADGDDSLYGLAGNDTLNGGSGSDALIGGVGADFLDGGDGFDTADYSGSANAVTIRLFNGTGLGGDAQGDVLSNIESVQGSDFADTLIGSSTQSDTLYGGAGNDYLGGLAGDDILIGGAGADTLDGGASLGDVADYSDSSAGVTVRLFNGTGSGGDAQGDTLSNIEAVIGSGFADVLIGSSTGVDALNGGDGDDALFGLAGNDILTGGLGADTLDGGASLFDVASYVDSAAGVTVRLFNGTGSGGDAQGDVISNIEVVEGSAFNDVLIGSSIQIDTLIGGAGDDALFGLAGNDTLIGGAGADTLDGGASNADTADYSASNAGVVVRLFNGTGLGGDAQGDTLTNIEGVIGSAFNDTLVGTYGQTDILRGSDGTDSLFGLSGNDIIDGGADSDTLSGGDGNDLFVFDNDFGQDTITDFSNGFDRLDVSRLDGVSSMADLTIVQSGADVLISADVNNSITLQNAQLADIDAADFIFAAAAQASLPSKNIVSEPLADDLGTTNLQQESIAEFLTHNVERSPIVYTTDQGFLEILTEDETGFDWYGYAGT